MSEEEKKAIEMLDKYITEHKLFNIKNADNLEENIKIVLHLVDEIYAKTEQQRELLKYKTERIEELQKELDQEKEKNKRIKDGTLIVGRRNGKSQELNVILEEYISKDKIKAKIEELEKDMVLSETRAILKELLEE